jgi:hypothetical protein
LASEDQASDLSARLSTSWFSDRFYLFAVATLLTLTVVFNLTDLLTTAIALRLGFVEGNSLIVSLSHTLDIGVIGTLGLSKMVFIIVTGVIAIIGVRSKSPRVRNNVVILLACATLILLVVSANNIYWITTAI